MGFQALHELSKLCVAKEFTLLVAWSHQEAGRYLETLKSYEHKTSDMLHGIKATDYLAQLRECLTSIRTVNKTDVITMLSTFGSLRDITSASADEFNLLPGFGAQKVCPLVTAWPPDEPPLASTSTRRNRPSVSYSHRVS